MKIKNNILFLIYTICIGVITGFIIWLFLKIMSLGIYFIWELIPKITKIPFYTIIVCLFGGILIGIWKGKFGNYPEELDEVLKKVKKDGRYQYKNIKSTYVSALLPLIFGGSIGPEAGLTGIIAGLCSWVSDKLKKLFKNMKELTSIGISASLGTIFNSPMFGFIEPIESDKDNKLPKASKIVLYFTAIISSLMIFMFLNHIFNSKLGIDRFDNVNINLNDWILIIPLSLIGIIAGYVYFLSHKIVNKIDKKLPDSIFLKCILGGLILGITGTLLPYTMFSGEHQISEIVKNGKEIGVIILILTGIIKLFITNTCIKFGFKGGHFFPCIFSGISIGLAISLIFNINPVFTMGIVTTSLLSFILRKPLATVLLLLIIFPTSIIIAMIIASIIGSIMYVPKFLKEEES